MTKFFCFFLFSLSLFSQEISIPTRFSQDGNLYKSLNKKINQLTQPIAEFKENQKCVVVDYIGRDNYRVTYKEWEGLVTIDDLLVNEEMIDLFYDYQERERAKLIESEKARKKKIQEILNKEDPEIAEQKRQDSIAQVEALKRKQLEEQEQARKLALAIKEQKQQDSIAQVEALKRKQLEEQEQARKLALAIREQKQQDSIAQVEVLKRKQLEEQEQARKLVLAIKEQKQQDSIVQVEVLKRKQLEEQEQARKLALAIKEQKQQDSIAQVEALNRKQLEEQEQARKLALAIKEKKQQDSIAQVEALKRKKLEEQEQAIKLELEAREQKRQLAIEARGKELLAEISNKRIQDSIVNVSEGKKNQIEEQLVETVEEEAARIEMSKFRAKCHYLINEYDEYYKKVHIRTDTYHINKNLTVELLKSGHKTNIFFDLNADLGCASYLPSNRSSVKVILENNQTVTFYHSWDMDCGDFSFKGRLLSSQIIKLKKSPIKSIILKGTKASRDITDIEYKEFFIDKLKCIE